MVIAPKKIATELRAATLATGMLFSATDLMRSERGVFGVVSSSSFELDMVSSFLEWLVLISIGVLFAELFDKLDHGVPPVFGDECKQVQNPQSSEWYEGDDDGCEYCFHDDSYFDVKAYNPCVGYRGLRVQFSSRSGRLMVSFRSLLMSSTQSLRSIWFLP
nr:MAG TPA: hypothetical protein [Caudoviricetes sp.]